MSVYLSQGILNPFNKLVIKSFADPIKFLHTIYQFFPEEYQNYQNDLNMNKKKNIPSFRQIHNILYRIEFFRIKNQISLLFQSDIRPDFSDFMNSNSDYFISAPKTIDINSFINSIDTNTIYRFRIRANPTVKIIEKDEKSGKISHKRIPLIKEESQINWLIKKSKKAGFLVLQVHTKPEGSGLKSEKMKIFNMISIPDSNFFVSKSKIPYLKPRDSKGNIITIYSVFYEGVLKISDKALFIKTMKNGLGRAKAYGHGLISIAPIKYL